MKPSRWGGRAARQCSHFDLEQETAEVLDTRWEYACINRQKRLGTVRVLCVWLIQKGMKRAMPVANGAQWRVSNRLFLDSNGLKLREL